MKQWIVILAILGMSLGCARIKPHPKPWTKKEKAMAAFFIATQVADAYTTKRHQDYPEVFKETNFVLGEYPKQGEIATYFSLTGLAVLAIAHFYPELRQPVLGICGGIGLGESYHNWRMVKDKDFYEKD